MLVTTTKQQVLIVDQDVAGVEPLRLRLCEAGLVVRIITSVSAAIPALREQPPQLLMIDWNIPGLAAYEVINNVREIRRPHAIRLIILSALAGDDHVVTALNLGADDYIVKPFSLREVVARVTGVLRAGHRPCGGVLKHGDLELDLGTNRVTAHGLSLEIRGIEYRLLEYLATHSGQTFSRDQLLSQIWGGDSDVDERTVDVNIQRLRKALSTRGCQSCIETVRGFGYRFVAQQSAAS